ncbi:MAG: type IV pilus assembly protein PilM [Patescibacteria group bacterium]
MLFNFSKNTFGLDVSEGALRLIQLKKRGKNLIIFSFNEIKIDQGIIINGEIAKLDNLVSSITKLVKTSQEKKIIAKDVVTVLPEPKTFIKVIEIPYISKEKDLSESIKEEIKKHIPLNLEEACFDWQIVEQSNKTTKILVGVVPQEISNSYFSAIQKAGLIPLIFEIEAIAIARAVIDEKEKNTKQAKIIIDFGATRTGLIVYDQQTVQFTSSLPISGNKITETIATNLKLELAQAEKAKIVCGLDPQKCEGAVLKIMALAIDNLANHINQAITFYKTNSPDSNAVTEIILCGGGANLCQIDKVLTEKLKLPVTIANPLINLGKNRKIKIPQDKLLSYTTAIGLGLRVWQKEKHR